MLDRTGRDVGAVVSRACLLRQGRYSRGAVQWPVDLVVIDQEDIGWVDATMRMEPPLVVWGGPPGEAREDHAEAGDFVGVG
eukprot:8598756-Pyramimonas_sp.AAC.1